MPLSCATPQINNRWHPDIPMATWVKPGNRFILETYDWSGRHIKNRDSADDRRDIDLSTVHFLSGPVGVEGTEPGVKFAGLIHPGRCQTHRPPAR